MFLNQEPFYWISASAAEATAVNPNGIITLLANSLNTYFINGKPTFIKGPKRVP